MTLVAFLIGAVVGFVAALVIAGDREARAFDRGFDTGVQFKREDD